MTSKQRRESYLTLRKNFKTVKKKKVNCKESIGVRRSSAGNSIINRFRNNHKGTLHSCTVHVDSINPYRTNVENRVSS